MSSKFFECAGGIESLTADAFMQIVLEEKCQVNEKNKSVLSCGRIYK